MRGRLAAPLAVSLALLLSGCQTIGGWFGAGGDGPEPAPLREITPSASVQRVWSVDVGKGTNRSRPSLEPFVEGGSVWAADHTGLITQVDRDSGRVERRVELKEALSAGPTVTDELILVGTFDGELIALDRRSGTERWRSRVSSEVLARPVLHDGVVVVRCIDGRVFGLDRSDGARLWVHDRSVPLLTLRGNSPPLARAGQVYIGYDDGRIAALRVADGSLLWEQQVSPPEGRTELERLADIDGPMLVVGTELYAVTYNGRLSAMALESGQVLWAREVASASGLSLERTQLVTSDRDDTIWVIDRRNGTTQWQDDQLERRRLTRPVFVGGLVAVADFEGYLHFYDADSGRIVARKRPTKSAAVAAPAVAGDTLYLLDEDGTLSAWRVGASG